MVPGESSSEQEQDEPDPEFVEVDPTGRYARYPEILGKGAFKTVYKAFDELEGIEVAWNQVKLADVLRNVDDLERLYSEVHLLKTLKHKNIIKFYNSWVDTKKDNINFITEVFTSGNLRQYRNKHKHVDLRALKNWSRQILSGLCYLHSNDPPIIHRDLKCDNIFVNGNQGEVKLGDLGLAAILQHADSAHSVLGTPEFMAPELYEEEYNELVDVYAFGMCLLELVTFEYPYSECINAAQIYKRVIAGVKPGSLARVNDSGVRQFIEKCIAHVSERLSARELLMDPFLQLDADKESIGCSPRPDPKHSDIAGQSNVHDPIEPSMTSRDFTVEGQRKEANTIFLKLRIADSTGHVRNIHFPFDIEADTSISVATEMVAELDLTDQDVSTIAAIIDAEIQAHIPGWMQGETSDGNCDNEKTVTDVFDSEAVDEVAALPNEAELPSGVLVLERLPSGRRYWSDSPKGTSSESPTGPTQSNISSELNPHAGDDLLSGVYEEIDNSSPSVNKGKGKLQDVEASTSFISGNPLSHDVIRNKPNAISNGSDLGDHAIGAATNGRANNDEASLSELLENHSEDVKQVVQTLETLFGEQQKEFLELKKKHDMAVAEILKGLHPEIQSRALKVCHKTVPPYMVSSEEEWRLKSP